MTHESEATAERRDSATPGNDVHTQIRIVGLGGSLAAPSASLTALKVALEGAASAGADTQILDLHTLDLPMFLPSVTPTEYVVEFCKPSTRPTGCCGAARCTTAPSAGRSRTRSTGSTSSVTAGPLT